MAVCHPSGVHPIELHPIEKRYADKVCRQTSRRVCRRSPPEGMPTKPPGGMPTKSPRRYADKPPKGMVLDRPLGKQAAGNGSRGTQIVCRTYAEGMPTCVLDACCSFWATGLLTNVCQSPDKGMPTRDADDLCRQGTNRRYCPGPGNKSSDLFPLAASAPLTPQQVGL